MITALFYGRSGTGKTTLLGTFPKPLLLVDVGEKGTDSLSEEEDVFVVRVDNWAQFEELYWELRDGDHPYKSVGLDALHTLQGLAIKEAKGKARKKEDDQTSQRDFGQAGALLTEWCTNYRDLSSVGLNVVFLAHDRISKVDTDDDEDVILPEVGPRLMPAVSSAVLGMVNVVGNTFIREEVIRSKVAGKKSERKIQYCLRVGAHGYYATKIRRPKKYPVPEYIVDPDYGKLINVIQGKGERPSTSRTTKRRLSRKG